MGATLSEEREGNRSRQQKLNCPQQFWLIPGKPGAEMALQSIPKMMSVSHWL